MSAGAAVVTSFSSAPPPGGGGDSSTLDYAIIAGVAAVALALCGLVGYIERKKAIVSRIFDLQHDGGGAESWAYVVDAKPPPGSRPFTPQAAAAERLGTPHHQDPHMQQPISLSRPVPVMHVWSGPGERQEELPAFLTNNKRMRVAVQV